MPLEAMSSALPPHTSLLLAVLVGASWSCATGAVRSARRGHPIREPMPFPWRSAGISVLAGIVLLVALAAITSPAARGGSSAAGLAAAVAGAATAAGVSCRSPAADDVLWRRLGLALLVGLAALAFAWALAFDSQQGSDFGVYWRCGTEPRTPLRAWVESCQSAYLSPSTLYWRRSLFYTAALGQLLGTSYPALKLANAALFALALALVLAGAGHSAGPRFGALAVAFLAAYPETWAGLTLASPDHVALPVVVLALLALARIAGPGPRTARWASALGLGACLFLAEQLRSVGPILLLALLLWVAFGPGEARPRLAGAGLALGAYLLLDGALRQVLHGMPTTPVTLLQRLAAFELSAPLNWMSLYRLVEYVWPAVPEAHRGDFALSLVAAEVLGGAGAVVPYLMTKAEVLFSGLGYLEFAGADLSRNPDTALTVARSTVPAAPWIQAALAGAARFVLGAAALGALRRPAGPLAEAAICWLGAFLVVVVGSGEVQPRYSALVAPALAILAASAAAPTGAPASRHRAGGPALAATAIALAVFAWGRAAPLAASWRADPWRGATLPPPPPAGAALEGGCAADGAVSLGGTPRALELRLDPATPCAAVALPVPSGWRRMGLVVTRADVPFLFEQAAESPYRWRIMVGPVRVAEGALGRAVALWQEVEIPPGAERLTLVVERVSGTESALVLMPPIRLG